MPTTADSTSRTWAAAAASTSSPRPIARSPSAATASSSARCGSSVLLLKAFFYGSLGALAWTHVGYPLAASAVARVRRRPVRAAPVEPTVTLVVGAHDSVDVIARLDVNQP